MDCNTTLASAPIFFALTKHLSRDGRQAIVLHLYRDIAPVVTRTIATVELAMASSLLSKCRRHLETLGVEPMAHRVHREPRILAYELSKVG